MRQITEDTKADLP